MRIYFFKTKKQLKRKGQSNKNFYEVFYEKHEQQHCLSNENILSK